MTERHSLRSAVYWAPIRDNKVLLIRRFNTGWRDGDYTLIGGHLDGNETVTDALLREAKEESGIVLKKEAVQVAHTMHRNSLKGRNRDGYHEYIDFFLTANRWEGEPRIMEPEKCDNMQWFPLDALPDNTLYYIKDVLQHIQNGVTFSESGWNGDAI